MDKIVRWHWLNEHRHPRLWRTVMYLLLCADCVLILINAWGHDIVWTSIFSVFCILVVFTIHRTLPDDDEDQDDEDEPEDWPDGEDAEKWLRSRLRIVK